ncbi:MAG: DNA gyrase inhibitor YacG [Bacteriovoracaceae bacterium]|nr:DNA gyrase inhibitor YacG [Bacteriovoracaceae bacterium]
MKKKKNSKLIVKCPKCKESFEYYSSDSRPFCSERCSNVDLGSWFNEGFSIPVEGPLEPEEVAELEKVLEEKFGNPFQ